MISDLPSFRSLRSWAQAHNMSPARSSRLLKGLEEKLGVRLVQRNSQGMQSTVEGERLAQEARDLLRQVESFKLNIDQGGTFPFQKSLVVGTRGFFSVALAPSIVRAVQQEGWGLQLIDLSPKEILSAAKAEYLNCAISLESMDLGKAWVREELGRLEWRMYGRIQHPLSLGAEPHELESYRIGHHVYWDGDKLVANEGMLHQTYQIRQLGYGTQTAVAALAIAAETNQVVCVPKVVAEPWIQAKRITEIPVRGIEPIGIKVYLSIHGQQITARLHRQLLTHLRHALTP